MTSERSSNQRGRAVRIVLPLLLLATAAAIGAVLIRTPPEVPKANPTPVAAVVGVEPLTARNVPVHVEAYGEVVAARQVRIQPQVSGRIVELHKELIPGGLIRADEPLFSIERVDYENAVAQAEAELEVATLGIDRLKTSIDSLRSQAKQAEAELDYLRWNAGRLSRLSEDNQAAQGESREAQSRFLAQQAALDALEAQIAEREVSVAGAKAERRRAETQLADARLALQRTTVPAPFDAIVLNESVEMGQVVGTQDTVATLAATAEFWVEASIPLAHLPDIRFADENGAQASHVTVSLATGQQQFERDGVVLRPLGDLDPRGRMARVLISIHDPLQQQKEGETGLAARRLLIGSYVRLAIEAGVREDVYTIPRHALRENEQVWVRDADGRLAIRDIHVVWRRRDDVLATNGFQPGDQLVTTHLASVVPGMPLSIREGDTVALERSSDSEGVVEP